MALVTSGRRLCSVLAGHCPFSSSSAPPPPPPNPTPAPSNPPPSTSGLPSRDPIIHRLARDRRFSTIESLLSRRNTSPKSEPNLASLILQYASAGMIDRAILAFNEPTTATRTALSLNALLSACNRSRKHSRRVPDLFADLSRKHSIAPDKVSYGILIKSHCLAGRASKALSILKEMEAKKVEITAVTYTTLLDSLYKECKSEEAEKLWKEMVRKGCSPDLPAYNVRAMHLAQKGKPGEVLLLIDEMESAGLEPDTITYNYLISCYCNHFRFEDAKKIYRGLAEKGCSPNSSTYKILLGGLCKRGDFDSATGVFNDSVNRDKVPDLGTVKRLVEGMVKAQKVKAAKKMVRWLKRKYPEKFMGDWMKLEKIVGLNADQNASVGLDTDQVASKEEEAIAA